MSANISRFLLTMAATLVAIVTYAQWNFRLDTSFRTSITEQYVNSLDVMPNGKLLLSGQIKFPGDMGSARGSARLLENGQQDLTFTTFIGGGKLTTWNDQYYVAVGQGLRRLNNQGYLDPTFVSLNTGPYFFPIQGGDYHVFQDGRVLITGSHQLSDSIRGFVGSYKLIWFSNEGYLDTTRIHRQANGALRDFKALPDGKFLCSCNCTVYDGQPVSRLFRVNADGSLDPTFTSGVTSGSIREYHSYENGKVLVGGRFMIGDDQYWLARFLPDGSFDASFTPPVFGEEGGGWPAAGTSVFDILEFRPGFFIVTGQFTTVNGQVHKGLCMIDDNGTLMSGLDQCGVGPFTFYNVTNASITNVYLGQDSSILYINGTYTGYDDGTINDPGQRFVSRLLVEEINVALQEEEPARSFSIQPNPATDQVDFCFDRAIGEKTSIMIKDLTGKIITTLVVGTSSDRITWNSTGLAPGVYLVDLVNEGQVVKTEKLIVQR